MAQIFQDRMHLPPVAEDNGEVTVAKILFSVQKIVEIANPARVIAFGSRARGDHHSKSDLDLAVIVDVDDPRYGLPPVTRVDLDVWMPIDLVVYDLTRDCLLRNSLNSPEAEVAREGKTLYDRNQGVIDRRAVERLV
jgi:predicted nucleotidyltransferase